MNAWGSDQKIFAWDIKTDDLFPENGNLFCDLTDTEVSSQCIEVTTAIME